VKGKSNGRSSRVGLQFPILVEFIVCCVKAELRRASWRRIMLIMQQKRALILPRTLPGKVSLRFPDNAEEQFRTTEHSERLSKSSVNVLLCVCVCFRRASIMDAELLGGPIEMACIVAAVPLSDASIDRKYRYIVSIAISYHIESAALISIFSIHHYARFLFFTVNCLFPDSNTDNK